VVCDLRAEDRAQVGLVLDDPDGEPSVRGLRRDEVVVQQRPELVARREPEGRLDPIVRLADRQVRADESFEQVARRRALTVLGVGGERRDRLRLDRDVRERLRERIGGDVRLVLRRATAGERDEAQEDCDACQPAACTTSRTAPSGPRRSVFSTRS
jgi:hypothetical protein